VSTADFITRTRERPGEDQCTIRARSQVPDEALCAYMAPMRADLSTPSANAA